MTEKDVLIRLCRLCTKVAALYFRSDHAADCFCGQSTPARDVARALFASVGMGGYRFDEAVLRFIEEAVKEKMSRKK